MSGSAGKGPLPPFAVYPDFLSEPDHADIFAWAMANEVRFKASVLFGSQVDPSRRRSRSLPDLGPLRAVLESQVHALGADLFDRTGTRPFKIDRFELELVAYGDGAHFLPHTDIPIGAARNDLPEAARSRLNRLLSGVYYFYREPKAFAGGELRLFRFGAGEDPGDWVDIAPQQNSLVVFPSWAKHQVLPVRSSSTDFRDSRFAVNCWLCRTPAQA